MGTELKRSRATQKEKVDTKKQPGEYLKKIKDQWPIR
jgi:hypothetical protein